MRIPRLFVLVLFLVSCAARTAQRPASGSEPGSRELEISFDAGGRTVFGTLSLPAAEGRHPAVLLIAGSGPTDRNWEGPLLPGTNGSGRQLAAALARAGSVVLRYDKLGTGRSTKLPSGFSWATYDTEQRAALRFLRSHAAVDPARVFLAGHSEGGAHAVRLAGRLEEKERPAGLVLLASAGRPMREILYGQLETQFRERAGLSGEQLAAVMKPIGAAIDDLVAGRPVDPEKVSPISAIQQLFAALLAPASIAFVRELMAFDTAAELARLRLPVIIVNGERDVQVSPTLDARRLEKAAREAGNSGVTLHLSPTADHVLKHEDRPAAQLDPRLIVTGYAGPGRALAPDVVSAIARWIHATR